MNKNLYQSVSIFFTTLLILLSPGQTMERYNDVLGRDKRVNNSQAASIYTLIPNEPNQLRNNEELREELLNSQILTNLKTLDLSDQGINDDFIRRLCANPSFAKLINLDLSNNPDITERSLAYIAMSNIIGSVRDLPQISGRYGVPSSEVYVKINNTHINEQEKEKYAQKPSRFDFSISYRNDEGKRTSHPVSHSIKWLQFR